MKIYFAYILNIMEYNSQVFVGLTKSNNDRLKKITSKVRFTGGKQFKHKYLLFSNLVDKHVCEVISWKAKVVEFSGSDACCNDDASSGSEFEVVALQAVLLQIVGNALNAGKILR